MIPASKTYNAKYGNYLDEFLGDAGTAGMLNHRFSYHDYGSDVLKGQLVENRQTLRKKFDQYPGWKPWMSEYCVMTGSEGKGGNGRDLTMNTALDVARIIHLDLTLVGVTAWQWWTAVSGVNYKDGLIFTDWKKPGDAESIITSRLLWAIGNYSRFVRPGMRRVELEGVSVAAKKGTKMAAKWSPARGAVRSQPFPLLRVCYPERPGAVKGAPLLGAAKRTLDGEDRSEMIAEEGKAGRKLGEKWSAILVPSPAASNTQTSPWRSRQGTGPYQTLTFLTEMNETGVVRLPNVAIPALHQSGSESPKRGLAVRQGRGMVSLPHGSQHGSNMRHRSIQLVRNRTVNVS